MILGHDSRHDSGTWFCTWF